MATISPWRSGVAEGAIRTRAKFSAWPRPPRSTSTRWTRPACSASHAVLRRRPAARNAAARALMRGGVTCGIRAAGVPARG
jgi:hypothetical protein